ncbi:aspartate kinase [Teredinibacter waterburyi]|uniref:aspartate kinase n=1 Tax=Teredinibacter waterburyi TaxID=1500538 RepID=UPI00165F000A|nr:aspartate kinase [Teredinibacter waterburyi]
MKPTLSSRNDSQPTVEKIGGTSMTNFEAVYTNIISTPSLQGHTGGRIFVVSAYGGITDKLLEHKKTGQPGVFAFFAGSTSENSWRDALVSLKTDMLAINAELFSCAESLGRANTFICTRIVEAENCLSNLQLICQHGHFDLQNHLATVREMLASIGEAHSAWNMAELLRLRDVNARFVDLTGWDDEKHLDLDERIRYCFADVDIANEVPIVTGYAHSIHGLMNTFDRGYSEMTFSRIAVQLEVKEAIIHKEFHLSSADPKIVGAANAVPIGRTNYDVADQLANLGMEAIHPRAAKGLRQKSIPLRVKNTFDPEHGGTLITGEYISSHPRVEIIGGCNGVYAVEVFDQDMVGNLSEYECTIIGVIKRYRAQTVAKDINANTITHYLKTNLKTVKRINRILREEFPDAEINMKKVSVVSAMGSDMQVPGILADAVTALAKKGISVLAMHQSMRQVDMQFIIEEGDYDEAILALHQKLIEVHDHGSAICLAV